MISHILDQVALEQVVTSYQDSLLFIPDFELYGWQREPGKIMWVFTKSYQVKSVFDSVKIWFPTYTKPAGTPVCDLVESPSIRIEAGNSMILTYSLEWWYYGDDDEPVTLRPTPGRSLIIECAIAV